jgi:hypothetical protein
VEFSASVDRQRAFLGGYAKNESRAVALDQEGMVGEAGKAGHPPVGMRTRSKWRQRTDPAADIGQARLRSFRHIDHRARHALQCFVQPRVYELDARWR